MDTGSSLWTAHTLGAYLKWNSSPQKMDPWNCIFISPPNAEGSFPARKTIATKAFLLTTQRRELGVISTSSSIKPISMPISLAYNAKNMA